MRSRFGGETFSVMLLVVGSVFLPGPGEAAQRLREHLPPGAATSKAVGRLPAAKHLRLAVGLPLRNTAELNTLLYDLYNPASPLFRHYLTPDQFTSRFGPTEPDYRAALEFFRARGFRITRTHPNRVVLDVEATVGVIERTFRLVLREYRHPREARTFFAPDTEPTLDLDVPIQHVSGLDNYLVPRPASLHLKPVDVGGRPVPQGGSGPNGTYMGKDFRAAYAPGVTLDGAGQYVGLVQFDGYYPSDITAYTGRAGMTNVPLFDVLVDEFTGKPGDRNVEVALDIEVCMAMAPGLAGIIVYEGLYPNDILNRMATDNLAKQLSASWTFPADGTTQAIFQQMAAQGQSYFNASGDNGAYSGPVSSPADSPYLTSVGGTTLSTRGPGQAWVSEKAWNWADTGSGTLATGGGVSTTWSIPSWQQGLDMTTNQGSVSRRNLPDVAMVADEVFVIADNGQELTVGGTSIASPLWAGFMALVNQQAAFYGQPPVGFLNPAVYALGQASNYVAAFHDVSTGNNTNSASPTRFFACPGYDLCTGWGTPNGRNLINALAPPPNAPVPIAVASTLVLETCSPGNGVIDPGEAVVVSFALRNVGGVATTNLVATLLSSDEVTPATAPQSYGALAPGGPTVSRQFAFIGKGACGDSIGPVLQLRDGSTSLGTVSFNLPLGAPVSTFGESFDAVGAPAIPSDWVVRQTGGGSNWVTSSAVRDTLPNAAFAYEPLEAGTCELISPSISITSPVAQLVFRNYFNSEAYPDNAALAYDGGVLEISIGGGSFTDILAAGGVFLSGGYTHSIDTAENPLDGRPAWAGLSGGFLTAVVNLPTAVAGQDVKFRWRFGFDNGNAYGSGGWYVDSVAVQEGYACCTVTTNADLAVTQTVFPNPGRTGQNLAYSLTVTNLGPGPAVNLTASDTLPANASFVFASPGYTNDGAVVSWAVPLLPAGRSTNFLVLVKPAAEGELVNNVAVGAQSFDPDLANNASASVTTVFSPPIFTLQPTGQVVLANSSVEFIADATGTLPLAYQWRFNSIDLPGETSNSLVLTGVGPSNMGDYMVVVTNVAGTVTSTPASLRVLVPVQLSAADLAVTTTNVSVSVSSIPGLSYMLEYKNSLNDAAWTSIPEAVIGDGSVIVLQDTNEVARPSRFYRVNTQ